MWYNCQCICLLRFHQDSSLIRQLFKPAHPAWLSIRAKAQDGRLELSYKAHKNLLFSLHFSFSSPLEMKVQLFTVLRNVFGDSSSGLHTHPHGAQIPPQPSAFTAAPWLFFMSQLGGSADFLTSTEKTHLSSHLLRSRGSSNICRDLSAPQANNLKDLDVSPWRSSKSLLQRPLLAACPMTSHLSSSVVQENPCFHDPADKRVGSISRAAKWHHWFRSHGPGDVGCMLLGLHAQHGDAGRAPLEFWLAFKGWVRVGSWREEGVCAEKVVQGDVAELTLLIGKAHVAMISRRCHRGRARGVGGDARRGTPRQHAGGDHGAAGSWARPQVVGDLSGTESGIEQISFKEAAVHLMRWEFQNNCKMLMRKMYFRVCEWK